MLFLKTTVRNNVSVLDFIVHYLHYLHAQQDAKPNN
jgi:hypothetical protein